MSFWFARGEGQKRSVKITNSSFWIKKRGLKIVSRIEYNKFSTILELSRAVDSFCRPFFDGFMNEACTKI